MFLLRVIIVLALIQPTVSAGVKENSTSSPKETRSASTGEGHARHNSHSENSTSSPKETRSASTGEGQARHNSHSGPGLSTGARVGLGIIILVILFAVVVIGVSIIRKPQRRNQNRIGINRNKAYNEDSSAMEPFLG
ncbi:uncharacterized protein LOC144485976 [Mustelus asterias]